MTNQKAKRFKSCCEEVTQYLKCVVCLKIAKAPVKECISAHICCSSCGDHVINCPICRFPYIYRNVTISKIINTFINQCPFKNYGCSKVLNPLEYEDHIESCSYRRIQCKICLQQVFYYQFRNHVFLKHPDSSWMTDSNKLYWKNFNFKKNSQKTEIVQAFDQLFWYSFSYNMLHDSLNIAVQFIGPRYQADRYMYEIHSGPTNHGNRIVFNRSTHYYMDDVAYVFRTDGFSVKKNTMIALSKRNVFVLYLNIFQKREEFQIEEYKNIVETVLSAGN